MDGMLPPGQRAISHFPRFGVLAYAKRLPQLPTRFELQIEREDGSKCSPVRIEDFDKVQRRELIADFHCVTTWTQRGLCWSGYGFRDFYEKLFVPRAQPRSDCVYLEFRALDGYTACILLQDLFQEEVLLADRLQGEALPLEHGAPMRLLVPQLYAFKSVKHVCAIRPRANYRRSFAERQTFAHPRGRVALEERGRGLPGPVYRFIYRTLVQPTLWYYRRVQSKLNRRR